MIRKIENTNNPLYNITMKFFDFPIEFRTKVEKDCNWSTPAFYRRLRLSTEEANVISKAEADKIIQLALEFAEDLVEFCEKYTKR